ncbi:mannonate dehydratase [Saccharicrinis sp. FJH54]|uniref:mannonate dehydratase n=1 Tax=Saccharicrinis sp. FJH54 TaxID=3344665 RepID=UPI0035D40182
MALEKTWRWFGVNDPVTLAELRQIGVEGIVTALHHIPNGEVWPVEVIREVKSLIESHGMRWSVVESLPVSDGIKIKSEHYDLLIANYKQSIRNLAECGIDRVVYNFMPVLDWARTDLSYTLSNGAESLYFDFALFVAFDVFIIERPGAENDYPEEVVKAAREKYADLSNEDKTQLAHNIIVVTQAFIDGAVGESEQDYIKAFLNYIAKYKRISKEDYRQHLADFLNEVVPVAEECGVKLAIHPDDPPFPILGLPRIVSSQDDLEWICAAVDSPSNGITFCTGSLSVRTNNDMVSIIKSLGSRIHFAHLRNNNVSDNGNFYESGHLEGRIDMYAVLKSLLEEQNKRRDKGQNPVLPFRPDHGLKLLDDFTRKANPGYPLIGRLKGMAEIDGLQRGIERSL